jgi:hypothetical protein
MTTVSGIVHTNFERGFFFDHIVWRWNSFLIFAYICDFSYLLFGRSQHDTYTGWRGEQPVSLRFDSIYIYVFQTDAMARVEWDLE